MSDHELPASYLDGQDDRAVFRAGRLITLSALMLAAFLAWAAWFEVTEVSTGTGKVIPSSREQVIQSFEGGIVAQMNVAEGDLVERGQVLAQLDPTKTASSVGESEAKYRAAKASQARLQAEVTGKPLAFPASLRDSPELIEAETALYQTRRRGLEQTLAGIEDSLRLVRSELKITENLAKMGASSRVEVIRLNRQRSELELKANEARSDYLVRAREELAKASAEADSLSEVIRGRSDSLTRLTLRSPVRGIVKDIEVNTLGGVVQPGGQVMKIVPMDERLLIETRIAPRDIAFIHPDQAAKVKISAYDYSVYGGLDGKVVGISPDTLQDEVKPEIYYYRVFIRTEQDSLKNKAGKHFAIVPGMIATVDIRTGEKTILDYLIKPLNRAKEALRER
ncbi:MULTISPECIES: HlyD family type I secretion periplasmic adaptor subunit [Pseudomonas]|jgi:adhesin transport system membrane fusion protein|uniref:Membrane fusion protein (MFP) family protein n=1 Tax=Pseudomonas juntendi TaxID=2666183 RepID=A0ABD4YIM3_9PSED|nr:MULTISPECIES: HlyD family type I secretion periplasmic adaptor subunit [Pseudomonas]MBS6039998.1 HlyD family type I secretion periplasmic adaptor subunit [Pseudomonas sp.]MDH0759132.1 HlyD family type I secretion periplasmic adaptor subunit [Pseudomonas juntendi]MDH1921654.1 HlyD family type I secretion periplasmic adaptor subunit [Pseudomonas juntendi]RRV63948.1 HlyD family type I secretion periplasmic adaptor subunit [Pseudomonas sp. p99-361]CAH0647979.1 Type I secretion system membrane f